MLVKNIFIICGVALVIMALVVSFVGLRFKEFPSKQSLLGIIGVALLLVLGTAGYAWALASEEQKEREEHQKGLAIGEEE